MCAWFNTNEKTLGGIANIATTIGVVGGLILIGVGLSQLFATKDAVEVASQQLVLTREAVEASQQSLEESKRALVASTVYTIQRDANDLLTSLFEDKDVSEYLLNFDSSKEYSIETKDKALKKIITLIQFYSTVYNQRRAGAITDMFWKSFAAEFCRFVRIIPVDKYWREKVVKGYYNEEFKNLGSNCLRQNNAGE